MVTGAYYPELSGGGLQCRTIVEALRGAVRFTILTTSTNPSLPSSDQVDGTPVHRIHIDVLRTTSKLRAAIAITRLMVGFRRTIDIVHLHGFSQKSTLIVGLARLMGKRVVVTLHTAEQDEPAGVRAQGRLAYRAYAAADLFVAISARMANALRVAGIPDGRVLRASNGVDVRRFRPAGPGERAELRQRLGLPADTRMILFVGFFSRDKGPHVLFDAWQRVREDGRSILVMVGATLGAYHEIDSTLAPALREAAARLGIVSRLVFVEETRAIEEYYRAADLFALPSRREAFGMALVEAMASGLPCVASRLPGVTDAIVRDGETGLLVEPHDVGELAGALQRLLDDEALASRIGAAARLDVERRFTIERTSRPMFDAYCRLVRPIAAEAASA